MLWGKCCYVLLRCKKRKVSASTFFGVEGKLENISVIANDSILIEVRVCMCVINELSFGTLRKYFYSLFSPSHFPFLLSLPSSLYDTTKRPPIAFVLLFTFQETMLDDDSRSSSGIKRTPTTLVFISVSKAYCVSGGTKLSCYDKKDIWRIKKFPLPCSVLASISAKASYIKYEREYVLVNNLLRWWWGVGDCKIERKKRKKEVTKRRRHT
jgi:hypothetical protein